MPPLGNTTLKHLKENLPVYPDDPEFSQQFACIPGDEATPSTSKPKQNLPHEKLIQKQAEAIKQFFKEEQDLASSHVEGLKLRSIKAPTPKHCIKQGPLKSSKKLKEAKEVKIKDEDEDE